MLCFKINMGKRFLLTILSLFIFTCSAFGYSNPRWFSMPITVYVPKVSGSTSVSNAFTSWQTESAGTVRFAFRSSKNMASRSDISITFVEKASNPYVVNKQTTVFNNNKEEIRNAYFYKLNIVISKSNPSGKAYSQSELYAISLRAVGEALGVRTSGDKGVMASKFNITNKKLTSEDIKSLNRVYKK